MLSRGRQGAELRRPSAANGANSPEKLQRYAAGRTESAGISLEKLRSRV
jgi:hypothetical protein